MILIPYTAAILVCSIYRIAGNFRGRKFLQIGENYDFCEENFRGLLAFAAPKVPRPQILQKSFANNHKTLKFVKVFSLERFYTVGGIETPQ